MNSVKARGHVYNLRHSNVFSNLVEIKQKKNKTKQENKTNNNKTNKETKTKQSKN